MNENPFLTSEEVARRLDETVGWTRDGSVINREMQARSFQAAVTLLASEALARFYADGFGFEEGFRFPADGALDYAFLKLPPLGIGIGRRPAQAALPDDRGWELWIYADGTDAAVERARQAGASVLEEAQDQPWGERVALVADPEGNRIRIGAEMAKAS